MQIEIFFTTDVHNDTSIQFKASYWALKKFYTAVHSIIKPFWHRVLLRSYESRYRVLPDRLEWHKTTILLCLERTRDCQQWRLDMPPVSQEFQRLAIYCTMRYRPERNNA